MAVESSEAESVIAGNPATPMPDPVFSKINQKLSDNTFGARDPPTIHRIPSHIRGDDGDFDPKFVSIGPFHRHNKELQPTEQLKLIYLQDLIDRSPERNKLQDYIDEMRACEKKARGQYSVETCPDSDEFVEMLVMDGCFILEFLVKRALGPVGSPFKEVKWNMNLLRNDLLLIENQIPFFVLTALYDKSHLPQLDRVASRSLLGLSNHYINNKVKIDIELLEEHLRTRGQPCHLLHLSHLCEMLNFDRERNAATSPADPPPPPSSTLSSSTTAPPTAPTAAVAMAAAVTPSSFLSTFLKPKSVTGILATAFYYIVSFLLMWRRPKRRRRSTNDSVDKAPRMIRSATKLQGSGVRFRKKEGGSFLNVSFTENGNMEIPFLSVQQSTISRIRNHIAFEQCCPDAGTMFTTYAVFMDNLIDTPDDVSILVEKGIIESKLGSEEEVARLFNGMKIGTSLGYDKHYLVDMFRRVIDYYETDRHRWKAQLIHGYFCNPWARTSFMAALLILVFTGTQTAFSIVSYVKGR